MICECDSECRACMWVFFSPVQRAQQLRLGFQLKVLSRGQLHNFATTQTRAQFSRRIIIINMQPCNHKIQEGSIARSTPSDHQESRRNVVHRQHREIPRRCYP